MPGTVNNYMNFRKWLVSESPIDLSIVHDPFDKPEFKKSLGNKKIVVYHGTSTKFFWEIVQGGLKFDKTRMNYKNTSPGIFFTFSSGRADMYSHKAVMNFGGKEIIFILEVPASLLEPDVDDREKWDRESHLQTMVKRDIPPKYITGVIYPVESHAEIPIRKFINLANRGKVPDISPSGNKTSTRFQRQSQPNVEHIILNYLHDLMQHSSFGILDGEEGYKFNQKVIQELQKPEYSWGRVYSWNGDKWIEFLEMITGEKNTEDYYKSQVEFQVPISRVADRYRD